MSEGKRIDLREHIIDDAGMLSDNMDFFSSRTGSKGCGKAITSELRHDRLLRLFRDSTATPDFPQGRTTIQPFREPSLHEVVGHERSRVRRIAFIPRDLQ